MRLLPLFPRSVNHPRSLILAVALVAGPVSVHRATARGATHLRLTRTRSDTAVKPDTAVTWVALSSRHGTLHGQLWSLLRAEIAKAKVAGRTPFVEVGATWCGPCVTLERSLNTPAMIDAFAGTYIIHLDADEWDVGEELGSHMGRLPNGRSWGGNIPIILAVDDSGRVKDKYRGDLTAASLKHFFQTHRWTAITK